MSIKDSLIVKDFINTQYKARDIISEIYIKGFVEYSIGLPVFDKNDKDISSSVEKLIDMDILDYNEYEYLIRLSENYEKYFDNFNDTNIAEIDKKIKNITRLIQDIKLRKIKFESFKKESQLINSNLRNIRKTILANITNLNSIQLQFKGEHNLEIRKNNLNECKDELELLSKTLKRLNTFLKNNRVFLSEEVESGAVKHEINLLITTITDASSNIVKILNELTRYLNQIEQEVKKIQHINRLYKLKYNSELYEKTNYELVLKNLKLISSKRSIKKRYFK